MGFFDRFKKNKSAKAEEAQAVKRQPKPDWQRLEQQRQRDWEQSSKILLINGDLEIQEEQWVWLDRAGYHDVVRVSDEVEAVEVMDESEGSLRLIILDMMNDLSEVDGYSALEMIREANFRGFILVTNVLEEEREEILSLGASEVLGMDWEMWNLVEAVQRLLPLKQEG